MNLILSNEKWQALACILSRFLINNKVGKCGINLLMVFRQHFVRHIIEVTCLHFKINFIQ